MRTVIAVLAGLLLVPLAAAARPGSPSALTMKVSTYKVLYGHHLVLSGRLWGKSNANRAVTMDARPYGTSAPHRIAVMTTDAKGRWSFRAGPKLQTRYQVRAGSVLSKPITVGVAPAVSVTALASGALRAHVTAMRHFTHKLVELQARNASGGWTTVDRVRLSRTATAVFSPAPGSRTLRVAMSVNQAGVGYLGAASHALVYRPQSLAFKPSTLTVLFGHRVTLSGRIVNGHAGERVSIMARRVGHTKSLLATVITGRGGMFSLRAKPAILTSYRARLGSGQASPLVVVDVRPTITVHQSAKGRIQTHVAAGRSLRGRMVQLQKLAGGHWSTVAKKPLGSGSTATFGLSLPGSLIRVAMSVNQAGTGYTGSTSHAVLYRAV